MVQKREEAKAFSLSRVENTHLNEEI